MTICFRAYWLAELQILLLVCISAHKPPLSQGDFRVVLGARGDDARVRGRRVLQRPSCVNIKTNPTDSPAFEKTSTLVSPPTLGLV